MNQVIDVKPEEQKKPQKYPGWRVPKDGGPPVLVHNHEQEERVTGRRVNPDGSPIEEQRPKPPTIEEVLAAGYEQNAAENIAAEEKEKAARGWHPYGDVFPTEGERQALYEATKKTKNPVLDNPEPDRLDPPPDPGPAREAVQDPLASAGW